MPTGSVRVCEVILVLAAFVLPFSRLDCPLQEPEETLYAEIPRQMLEEGRFVMPVRHGQAYYHKPPLMYWLVMGVYQICGVHDWAARLVPAAATALVVLVAYAWGKHTVGPRAAFVGALTLCLWPRFAQMARMLTMNSLLTLWVIAALAAAHLALSGPTLRRRWWLLSAMACGLGFLTKGPVAVALVVPPLLAYQFLDRRCARASRGHWSAYGAVMAGIALPWFIVVAVRDPVFLSDFVWTHHVRRFLDPIDHLQPAWYYLPGLLWGMLPWTLLLPGFVNYLAGRAPALPPRPAPLGLFLLAGLWCLVFFSASGCKRPSYILPAMPPLALALGCYLNAAFTAGQIRLTHWVCAATMMFLLLTGAAWWLLPGYAAHYSLRDQIVPQAGEQDAAIPVLCYPRGWDAVSFYLQRSDVRVFRPDELDAMVEALGRRPVSLVVVKADTALERFLASLPERLEFTPCGRHPNAVVGWVRRRPRLPACVPLAAAAAGGKAQRPAPAPQGLTNDSCTAGTGNPGTAGCRWP
jgi:4-amino-4-deoxy-L-arabinose transferase-like glycosyltransferase